MNIQRYPIDRWQCRLVRLEEELISYLLCGSILFENVIIIYWIVAISVEQPAPEGDGWGEVLVDVSMDGEEA
jgi:hypothetical protein